MAEISTTMDEVLIHPPIAPLLIYLFFLLFFPQGVMETFNKESSSSTTKVMTSGNRERGFVQCSCGKETKIS